jgi:hypothetical protein
MPAAGSFLPNSTPLVIGLMHPPAMTSRILTDQLSGPRSRTSSGRASVLGPPSSSPPRLATPRNGSRRISGRIW